MPNRNPHTGVQVRARRPRCNLAYALACATAMLCACTSASNWKSSSALSSAPRTAKAPATVSASTKEQPTEPASGSTAGSADTPNVAAATGAGTTQARDHTPRDMAGAQSHADAASGAMLHGQDDGLADADSAADSGDSGSQLSTEALADGAQTTTASTPESGAAGMLAQEAAGTGTSGEAISAARGTPLADGQSDDGTQRGISAAADDGSAGGALDTTAAAQRDAGQTASQTSAAGATGVSPAPPGHASTPLDTQAAADGGREAAGVTAAASPSARPTPPPSPPANRDSSSVQDLPPPEVSAGLVEAPGRRATRMEEVIPQTLGGLLPLTIGIDGQGEFDFDQAVLREQVRELLDTLAARLKDAEYDRLEIVGHTDRIGSEEYNQYLSERRAWAVARYLVDQGVPASKLRVEGRGMHEPMTHNNECQDQLAHDALIVCLQKDRRVVISASIRKVDVKVQ